MSATLRDASPDDAPAIVAIYNHYIVHTTVTFEEVPLAAEEMAARIREVTSGYPWLVCEREGTVVGYAYANRFHARSAYRRTAETTVYVAHDAHRAGVGTALYGEIFKRLGGLDLHRVLGLIALPNAASVGLHERFGFVKVGEIGEVGWKFGRYIDVGFWERAL